MKSSQSHHKNVMRIWCSSRLPSLPPFHTLRRYHAEHSNIVNAFNLLFWDRNKHLIIALLIRRINLERGGGGGGKFRFKNLKSNPSEMLAFVVVVEAWQRASTPERNFYCIFFSFFYIFMSRESSWARRRERKSTLAGTLTLLFCFSKHSQCDMYWDAARKKREGKFLRFFPSCRYDTHRRNSHHIFYGAKLTRFCSASLSLTSIDERSDNTIFDGWMEMMMKIVESTRATFPIAVYQCHRTDEWSWSLT